MWVFITLYYQGLICLGPLLALKMGSVIGGVVAFSHHVIWLRRIWWHWSPWSPFPVSSAQWPAPLANKGERFVPCKPLKGNSMEYQQNLQKSSAILGLDCAVVLSEHPNDWLVLYLIWAVSQGLGSNELLVADQMMGGFRMAQYLADQGGWVV